MWPSLHWRIQSTQSRAPCKTFCLLPVFERLRLHCRWPQKLNGLLDALNDSVFAVTVGAAKLHCPSQRQQRRKARVSSGRSGFESKGQRGRGTEYRASIEAARSEVCNYGSLLRKPFRDARQGIMRSHQAQRRMLGESMALKLLQRCPLSRGKRSTVIWRACQDIWYYRDGHSLLDSLADSFWRCGIFFPVVGTVGDEAKLGIVGELQIFAGCTAHGALDSRGGSSF